MGTLIVIVLILVLALGLCATSLMGDVVLSKLRQHNVIRRIRQDRTTPGLGLPPPAASLFPDPDPPSFKIIRQTGVRTGRQARHPDFGAPPAPRGQFTITQQSENPMARCLLTGSEVQSCTCEKHRR